ncbi:MAG: hypothetical protein KDE58_08775 [Caldilineaceae bacterium]|nr:hypothetical protein [Caldilineaceae bacterium]
MSLPYAEDVNYWKSGQSSPDAWIDKARREIKNAGGKILGDAFGNDATTKRSAYMLSFQFGDDVFKAVWPVLPSRTANDRAARIQAATMLYHDVKARCVSAKVLGGRVAFFSYIQLPDGRSAAAVELDDALPMLFRPQLPMLTVVED